MSPRALAASLLVLVVACADRTAHPPPLAGPGLGGGGGASGGAGGSGPVDVTAGPIISSNPVANWEAETHLAVASDGRLFAVWIALQLSHRKFVGYARSKDGGSTWSKAGLVPTDPDADAVDPSVAVDALGVFRVAWLELPSAGGRRVKTAAYIDTGDVFSIPVEVTDPQVPSAWDKPWILPQGSGGLLLVWGTESGSSLVMARSADGKVWERVTFAPDGTLRNVATPCAAGQGQVYVPYLVPGGVELTRSDDTGVTWSKPTRVDAPGRGAAFEPPSCAALGNEVWVLYGTSPDAGDDLHTPLLDGIVVAHSTNGGATFDRHTVGDSAGARTLLPFLSRAPNGRLDVVYYRGHEAFDSHAALRWARSSDGVTWGEVQTLDAPLGLTTKRDGFDWLGDYIGVVSRNDGVYVTFADNESGPGTLSHVRFGTAKAQ